MARLMKLADNNFPEYTKELERIADQLEDIYDLVKEGGPVYKMGVECDEQLAGWYNNLGTMAKNVKESVRDVLTIAGELRVFSDDIQESSKAYNYKEEES